MQRLSRRGILAGAALSGAALAATGARAQSSQISIATGTTGGVYYPLGGGLANLLSRQVAGLSATVEVTGGSVANLQLLGANRIDLVFSQVDAAVDAVKGEDKFKGRPVPVRAIAVLYTNRMQVVTTSASGITSLAGMRGKRISTGAPGSATEVMAFRLIEAAGLDRDKDFRARERLSPAESTNAVKDGKLDAYFFVSGVPTSAVTDLGASPGVTLVLVDHDEFVPKINAKYGPVYFAEEIAAGTYPGQKTPNKQMSVANILAVRADMPDSMVETLLKTAWNGREDLARVHAEGRNFTLEAQKTAAAGVPWHPVAERFWQAQGAKLA
jgi:TRAP transporter TAXI family solute receptor